MRILLSLFALALAACTSNPAAPPGAGPADLAVSSVGPCAGRSVGCDDLGIVDFSVEPGHEPADFAGVNLDAYNLHGGGDAGDRPPDGGNLAEGGVYQLPDGGTFALPDLAMPPRDLSPAPPHDLSSATPQDLAGPHDLATAPSPDLAHPTGHAPSPLVGATTLLSGTPLNDVSTDQGGGIWAVSNSTVYYFPAGKSTPYTYDQKNGLARGWYSWQPDTYYSGAPNGTVTWPVTFTSVAGATSGQAIVGNVGAIADRLQVNPATGAVVRVENMKVTSAQQPDPTELAAQQARVVATHRVAVDLNGTFSGTAYLGGWHGFSAFHGVTADCGCLAFEEHQHYFGGPSGCDNTPGDTSCFDGDVRGLAFSPTGDVWAGDRHFVQLLPQRSSGANADFFQNFAAGFDVFPLVKDEVSGLAVDARGGVYVASEGNGLAYLAPGSYSPTYWSSATTLPTNLLQGVAVDRNGEVWIAAQGQGIVRYNPAANAWIYYLQSSGLPSNDPSAIYVDPYSSARRTVYVATDYGLSVYSGP